MSSTSVHFPRGVLAEIDRRATEEGLSRNKFIVESCRKVLDDGRPAWPAGFFSNAHLTRTALKELRESATDFEQAIGAARKSRRTAPF